MVKYRKLFAKLLRTYFFKYSNLKDPSSVTGGPRGIGWFETFEMT